MSKLLIETRLFEGRVNEDSHGRTIVKGILQRAGAPNQNERVYPVSYTHLTLPTILLV